MKIKLLIIPVLMVIANSHSSPIEGVFDKVSDTTSAIKNGIGGMLSQGRSLVFGANNEEQSLKEGKQVAPSEGIIDKISLKIHDVSDNVRETFRNVLHITDKDTNNNGKGIIKHVYDGVTNKVDRVKGFLFGTTTQKTVENKETDDATKLKELVDKILANSSPQDAKNTYDILNNIIEEARKNATKVNKPQYDGTGLIDIRALDLDDKQRNTKEYSDNTINGVNAAYDKVGDDFSQTYNRGKASFDNFRQNVAGNINSGTNYFKENVDRFASDARNTFERYTN